MTLNYPSRTTTGCDGSQVDAEMFTAAASARNASTAPRPSHAWLSPFHRTVQNAGPSRVSSGRPDRIEELAHLELEAVAVTGKRLRRRQYMRRGRARLAGAALHVGDVGGDLLGALGRLLHVTGNLLGRRTLLF